MTRCGTDLRHQYGIFGGKSQTFVLRNATRAGSEEGRLFSQATINCSIFVVTEGQLKELKYTFKTRRLMKSYMTSRYVMNNKIWVYWYFIYNLLFYRWTSGSLYEHTWNKQSPLSQADIISTVIIHQIFSHGAIGLNGWRYNWMGISQLYSPTFKTARMAKTCSNSIQTRGTLEALNNWILVNLKLFAQSEQVFKFFHFLYLPFLFRLPKRLVLQIASILNYFSINKFCLS